MTASKELRGRLRRVLDVLTMSSDTGAMTEVVVRAHALLDALDAEEAKGIVGYVTVPLPMWESPKEPPKPEEYAFCRECGERFPARRKAGDGVRYLIGPFDWRVYPEYGCACREAYRRANGYDEPEEAGP